MKRISEMAAAKELTGQRFGRLVVLGLNPEPYHSPSGKQIRRWDCICDCGAKATVLMNQLTSGKARSCGCLQRETAANRAVDLTGRRYGKWTVLERAPLEHKGGNGEQNGWLCRCDCGNERIVHTRNLTTGRSKSCGCDTKAKAEKRMQEDNVLGRYNGTVVSAIQPDRGANKNSKSGIKGVYWSNREGRWIAKIGFQGKNITIGRFSDLSNAVKARKDAEKKYFQPIIETFKEEKENEKNHQGQGL